MAVLARLGSSCAPFWEPRGSFLEDFWVSFSGMVCKSVFEWIWDRFGRDLGSILDRFFDGFGNAT